MARETAPKKEQAVVQVPTIGRTVHYYTDPHGEQRAAVVSDLDGDSVTLHVFNSLGVIVVPDVPGAPVPTPGHWSWPEVTPVESQDDDNSDD